MKRLMVALRSSTDRKTTALEAPNRELGQEGAPGRVFGLMKAVDKFEYRRGYTFGLRHVVRTIRIERVNHAPARTVAAPSPHQLSRKLLRILDRLGCLSFLNALASIWRMRSRVTENCRPTSSSVWSLFMPMPKRMRRTRSSRAVTEASTRVVVSRRFDWIAASIGRIAFLSSIKSP